MAVYSRKVWWAALGVCAAAIFPFYSEAHSDKVQHFSVSECKHLSSMRFVDMSSRQQQQSEECDHSESAQNWEQHYGALDGEALMAGVVYE